MVIAGRFSVNIFEYRSPHPISPRGLLLRNDLECIHGRQFHQGSDGVFRLRAAAFAQVEIAGSAAPQMLAGPHLLAQNMQMRALKLASAAPYYNLFAVGQLGDRTRHKRNAGVVSHTAAKDDPDSGKHGGTVEPRA